MQLWQCWGVLCGAVGITVLFDGIGASVEAFPLNGYNALQRFSKCTVSPQGRLSVTKGKYITVALKWR